MKRKRVFAVIAAVVAGGAAWGPAGTAMAKTTVELAADHQTVRTGHAVTLTGSATTDPNPAPKDLRLCLQTLTVRHGYVPFGRCVPVTKRPFGVTDMFIIKVTFRTPGHHTLRALAITPSGHLWTAPSSPVTITVH